MSDSEGPRDYKCDKSECEANTSGYCDCGIADTCDKSDEPSSD